MRQTEQTFLFRSGAFARPNRPTTPRGHGRALHCTLPTIHGHYPMNGGATLITLCALLTSPTGASGFPSTRTPTFLTPQILLRRMESPESSSAAAEVGCIPRRPGNTSPSSRGWSESHASPATLCHAAPASNAANEIEEAPVTPPNFAGYHTSNAVARVQKSQPKIPLSPEPQP